MKRKNTIQKIRYPYYARMSEQYNAGLAKPCTSGLFSPRKNKIFHIISLVLLLLSAGYGALFCRLSYVRLWNNIYDFGRSIAYFFLMFFPDFEFVPSVNSLPVVNFESVLPFTWEEFAENMKQVGQVLFTKDCFIGYMTKVSDALLIVSRILILLFPVIMAFSLLSDSSLSKTQSDLFQKSRFLNRFLYIQEKCWYPLKQQLLDFRDWQRGYYYKSVFLFIWLLNFNAITVIVGALAFYFYFIRAFDLLKVYVQVYRLSLDIAIGLSRAPLLVWIVIGYILFNSFRRKIGFSVLRAHEQQNLAFVRSLPVAFMINGTVGAGKTTMLTDISLTLSCEFRNVALEKMYKYDKFFPDFPWLRFEKHILYLLKIRRIYNFATIEEYFSLCRAHFESTLESKRIWGYDCNKYPLYHDDGIVNWYIWDILEYYCKMYLVYTLETSLLVSNYAIREDFAVMNAGNFILYNFDFFSTPSYNTGDASRFSHILNYDTLRVGKKMIQDGYADSFEFGIIDMTEGGKERGNNLENLTIKKTDDKCNVKNDLFSYRLKMIRHAAEVDGYSFVKVCIDEQRAMSLGATDRDLCQLIFIQGVSDSCLSFPFFSGELLTADILNSKYKQKYYSYRFSRGNQGLFLYLSKHMCVPFLSFVNRICNLFGYKVLTIKTTLPGMENEEGSKRKYFISFKKDYCMRFATDTHAHFFRKRALRSDCGLNDYPTYESIHATDDELHLQRSHFINEMDILNNESKKGDG